MRVIERPFSEFLRQPNDVVAEVAEHDVVLRRRNAPALRLSQADRYDDRSAAFEALARLLRNLAVHHASAFDAAVEDAFGWSTFLPKSDRRLFVEELTRTRPSLVACANQSRQTAGRSRLPPAEADAETQGASCAAAGGWWLGCPLCQHLVLHRRPGQDCLAHRRSRRPPQSHRVSAESRPTASPTPPTPPTPSSQRAMDGSGLHPTG